MKGRLKNRDLRNEFEKERLAQSELTTANPKESGQLIVSGGVVHDFGRGGDNRLAVGSDSGERMELTATGDNCYGTRQTEAASVTLRRCHNPDESAIVKRRQAISFFCRFEDRD
ncbi:hypothetical protein LWI29_002268 [Acer saccharum]|uniref:Uncharacterized protein n=1 Tax=Acer saccharum TaxID=4024 RepID=A0AA39VQ74_ACESA|nr:hypothetical protein LWI29_002268 [Acer saccharum]